MKEAENSAIKIAFITGGITFALAAVSFYGEMVPLFGRYSIGLSAAFTAAIAVFIVFSISWRKSNLYEVQRLEYRSKRLPHPLLYWLKLASLAFIYSALTFMVYSVIFFVLQEAFFGVTLGSWIAAILVALSAAAASYLIYPFAQRMTLAQLSVSLAAFLVAGVLSSAISMEDPYWWQYNFSSLGTGNPFAAAAFNVTLVVAGTVVVAITDFIVVDLKKIAAHRKTAKPAHPETVRWLLMLTGAFLACVGLFVWNEYPLIHNSTATGMMVLFLILVAGLPKYVPYLSRSFYVLSYAMIAGIVVSAWLFIGVGYFNLTALELVAASIIFSWLVVFIRQLATFDETQLGTTKVLKK